MGGRVLGSSRNRKQEAHARRALKGPCCQERPGQKNYNKRKHHYHALVSRVPSVRLNTFLLLV